MILRPKGTTDYRPSERAAWAMPLVHLQQTRPNFQIIEHDLSLETADLLKLMPPMRFRLMTWMSMLLGIERTMNDNETGAKVQRVNQDDITKAMNNLNDADFLRTLAEILPALTWHELISGQDYLVQVSSEMATLWETWPTADERFVINLGVIANIVGESQARMRDGTPITAVRMRAGEWPVVEFWAMTSVDRWPEPFFSSTFSIDLSATDPVASAAKTFDSLITRAYKDRPHLAAGERSEALHLAGQMAPYLHAAKAMQNRSPWRVDVTMPMGDIPPVSVQVGSDTLGNDELIAVDKSGKINICDPWKPVWLIDHPS